MNALVTIAAPHGAESQLSPPPGAEPVPTSAEGARSIFSPRHQAAFLENLATNGNVRLACRAARVSPQTAYRARRSSPALARAWDAALLAARHVAEEVLADRALNGVEESVFYHGEEIATRRRYDSRLLLAHLARLDRLAEREDVADALPQLDEQIEGLRRGEGLAEPACVPAEAGTSCGFEPLREAPAFAGAREGAGARECAGASGHAESSPQDPVPCVPSCRESHPCETCGGQCSTPGATLTQDDCMWLGNRLDRMDAARPHGAPEPFRLLPGGDPDGRIETMQLLAFEAGEDEWWLLVPEDLVASPRDACAPPPEA